MTSQQLTEQIGEVLKSNLTPVTDALNGEESTDPINALAGAARSVRDRITSYEMAVGEALERIHREQEFVQACRDEIHRLKSAQNEQARGMV